MAFHEKITLSSQDKMDAVALLVLRLGLAWFIFLWAAHKIITPGQYQDLARNFDGVEVSLSQVYLAGARRSRSACWWRWGCCGIFPMAVC